MARERASLEGSCVVAGRGALLEANHIGGSGRAAVLVRGEWACR